MLSLSQCWVSLGVMAAAACGGATIQGSSPSASDGRDASAVPDATMQDAVATEDAELILRSGDASPFEPPERDASIDLDAAWPSFDASFDAAGFDANGPCPPPVAPPCVVEGQHLCGIGCEVQCYCVDGEWQCAAPPCPPPGG